MRYSTEWRKIIERLGRWIDFDRDYKTLDKNFMESVWWVFKQLFNKGMVYKAFKVMPYSTACTTPLSNFEANQNYKDVSDPSIVVTFPSVDDKTLEFLAWTTTPWTLPSNVALCVNPDLDYVRLHRVDQSSEKKRDWLIVLSRVEWVIHQLKLEKDKDIVIVGSPFKGSTLVGQKYLPLFNYFYDQAEWRNRAFCIIADPYVTDDTGTGCVHCAPAFGEDDYRVCLEKGIIEKEGLLPCPVDDDGVFTQEVENFKGLHVKAADKHIKEELKKKGRLLINAEFVHSYPHCWRSDQPLIYKAVPSWFVKVESIKENLLKNNEKTYWVPSNVKEKRFHNWLADARDWCISRNRYWGTPIPLWISQDMKQIICIGSISELENLTSQSSIDDIHRHHIDHLTIPDPRGPNFPPLKRIEEVFDCWFESGSMPYAQQHYPFENAEIFENNFPANFIAEGLDQTRGWFYTLMVIATALFDRPPFQNLIVNGLVLASDGKKMSKRLKNYPDPLDVVHRYGADALRLFLVNSPVVKAESLKFREEGVKEVVRDVLLPWYHAYRFFIQEATRYESSKKEEEKVAAAAAFQSSLELIHKSPNLMDRWIFAVTQSLVKFTKEQMAEYKLYTVIPELIQFLNQLTNWYVRLNRDRMRGMMGHQESKTSLSVLFEVLFTITRLMSPFTPYLTEYIYQNMKRMYPEGHLKKQDSIHFLMMPEADSQFLDQEIEKAVELMQAIVVTGRTLRERKKVSLKSPLKEITLVCPNLTIATSLEPLLQYIKDELNVMECQMSTDASLVELSAVPNFRALGGRVGKDMQKVIQGIKNLKVEELIQFEKTGSISVANYELKEGDISLHRQSMGVTGPNICVESAGPIVVILNFETDVKLFQMALVRELTNRIQKLRKSLNLQQNDENEMFVNPIGTNLKDALNEQKDYITKCLRRELKLFNHEDLKLEMEKYQIYHQEIVEINDEKIEIVCASKVK